MIEIAETEMATRFQPKISIEDIFYDACGCFNLDPDRVKYGYQCWTHTKVKKIVSYVAIHLGGFSYPQIASALGYKSHTSIITNLVAIRKHKSINQEEWIDAWEEYTKLSKLWPLIK